MGAVAWWDAGQEGTGKPRQGPWECWAPGPPAPARSCWRIHKDGFVYRWPWSQREGVLPLGWAAGRQSFVASKDLAVRPRRPHTPRKERYVGSFSLPLSLPPPNLPGDPARLHPSLGLPLEGLRLMSDLQECPEVTEVGGTQAGVYEPSPGVSLP